MASYKLTNVEERGAKHRRTFVTLPRKDRKSLRSGDSAKLIFDDKERRWVDVTAVFPDGSYEGVLANEPVSVKISVGDTVRFGPEHVLDFELAGRRTVR